MIRVILYGIFYILLSIGIVLFLFANENYVDKKLAKWKEPLLEKIFNKYNLNKKNRKILTGIIDWFQTIFLAFIIFLLLVVFYIGNYTVPTGSMYPTIIPGERFFAEKVSYKFRAPERGEIIVFKEPINNKERYTKRLIGLPGEYVQIKNNTVYINNQKYDNGVIYYNDNTLIGNNTWKVPQKGDYIKLEDGIFLLNGRLVSLDYLRDKIEDNSELLDDIEIRGAKFLLNGNILTGPIYDREVLYELIKGNTVKLDSDYYFVLGDNSINSKDSRYWGFVSEKRLIGRMLLRIWPPKRIGIVK